MTGAVFAAFLLLAAPSCSTSQAFQNSGKPRLQFEGDSITVRSVDDINAHYGSSYDVAINGLIGTDTYWETGSIAAQAELLPDVEIINLGTNDGAHIGVPWYAKDGTLLEPAETVESVLARYDTFASEFPPSTCVIFVTINTHAEPAYGPAFNDHIRSTFAHVADLDAAWQPEYFNTPDNPHPNATGRQALLALEDQAIAGCPSADTTTTSSASTTTTIEEPSTTVAEATTTVEEPPTTIDEPPTTVEEPTTTTEQIANGT